MYARAAVFGLAGLVLTIMVMVHMPALAATSSASLPGARRGPTTSLA